MWQHYHQPWVVKPLWTISLSDHRVKLVLHSFLTPTSLSTPTDLEIWLWQEWMLKCFNSSTEKDTRAREGTWWLQLFPKTYLLFYVAEAESNLPVARKPLCVCVCVAFLCGHVRDWLSRESHLGVQELTVLQRTTQCLQTTNEGSSPPERFSLSNRAGNKSHCDVSFTLCAKSDKDMFT